MYNSQGVTTGGSTVSCWEGVQHQLAVIAYDNARDTRPTGTSTQVRPPEFRFVSIYTENTAKLLSHFSHLWPNFDEVRCFETNRRGAPGRVTLLFAIGSQ
jgi:hypothetical protein